VYIYSVISASIKSVRVACELLQDADFEALKHMIHTPASVDISALINQPQTCRK
jgi:hypothetical protein